MEKFENHWSIEDREVPSSGLFPMELHVVLTYHKQRDQVLLAKTYNSHEFGSTHPDYGLCSAAQFQRQNVVESGKSSRNPVNWAPSLLPPPFQE